jgi:hypothetical protein
MFVHATRMHQQSVSCCLHALSYLYSVLCLKDVRETPRRLVEVLETERKPQQQQEPPALQQPAALVQQLAPISLSLLQAPFVDSVTGETMSPINSSSTRLAWPTTGAAAAAGTAARSGSATTAAIPPIAAKATNRTY